ncbi:MAG: response regulator [Treponema sp.]|nr:response regulator [Treponema sp.]
MGHIIHVDNSRFFRKAMKFFLAELGLESVDFERGADAMTAIRGGKVSCLVTGLELPDMKGEDLIAMLDLDAYPMTVIAVTSSNDDGRIIGLEALGVKAIIQKGGDWKEKLREYF